MNEVNTTVFMPKAFNIVRIFIRKKFNSTWTATCYLKLGVNAWGLISNFTPSENNTMVLRILEQTVPLNHKVLLSIKQYIYFLFLGSKTSLFSGDAKRPAFITWIVVIITAVSPEPYSRDVAEVTLIATKHYFHFLEVSTLVAHIIHSIPSCRFKREQRGVT